MKLEIENQNFVKKFRLKEYSLAQSEHWIISLRPKQITFGTLVLSLNRSCTKFSGIHEQELKDLNSAYEKIENLLFNKLGANKINYLALMMEDEHIHFHVIPRYSKEYVFNDINFHDKHWPKAPGLEAVELDEVTLQNIYSFLKKEI